MQKWVDQGTGIRKAINKTDYICASNLMILMQWRMDMDERWETVNNTTRKDSNHMDLVSMYGDLRESLHHIISSLELVVLLQKLGPRTT